MDSSNNEKAVKNTTESLSDFAKLIKEGKKAKIQEEKQVVEDKKKSLTERFNLSGISIDSLGFLSELAKANNEKEKTVVENPEYVPIPEIVEEVVPEPEKVLEPAKVEEAPKPEETIISKTVKTINKISENTNLFSTTPVDKPDPNFKAIQDKLRLLEQWVGKISAAGPGSGSYWLNDLGDTYHIGVKNATNNQVLTFDSNLGKWTAKGLGQITHHGAFHSDQDTTLTSTVTNNSTTPLPVESTSGFYTSGYLIIGDEIISYTGVTPTSFTGITRAVSGSNSHQHPAGSPVGTAQTAPAGVPSDVRFDVTNISSGVTLNSSNGALTCVSAGTYNFQFSLQLANFGNSPDDFIVWFLRNDVAVPASASYATVPSIHAGIPGSNIITVNIFHAMNAGDTMRMKFASIGGTSVITSYPPSYHLEGVPQSPGVIFTVNQVA